MKTKNLIFGATSAAIGYALTHDDCIIAEKGMNLCTDYTDCMCVRKTDTQKIPAYCSLVQNMYKIACERNLVGDDGAFHPFPLVGIAAQALLEKNVKVLSFTKPLAIVKENEGYYVSLYSLNSYIEIHCDCIIDATAYGDAVFESSFGRTESQQQKSIVASLRKKCDSVKFEITDSARIICGKFGDEAYLELDLSQNDSYSDGFNKLHSLWQSICHDEKYKGFDYIDTAHELLYQNGEFAFVKLADKAYRLVSDNSKDAFYNINCGALAENGREQQ